MTGAENICSGICMKLIFAGEKRDENLTEWRPVKGFEEKYEVSDDGRIRRISHIVGNRVYKHREVKQNLSTNVASVILTGYDGRKTTRHLFRKLIHR